MSYEVLSLMSRDPSLRIAKLTPDELRAAIVKVWLAEKNSGLSRKAVLERLELKPHQLGKDVRLVYQRQVLDRSHHPQKYVAVKLVRTINDAGTQDGRQVTILPQFFGNNSYFVIGHFYSLPQLIALTPSPEALMQGMRPLHDVANLVFLTFASNRCYPDVVDKLPNGVEVDVFAGTWSQPRGVGFQGRDTFAIGTSAPNADLHGLAVIGVYDRTDTPQLKSMVWTWGEMVRDSR